MKTRSLETDLLYCTRNESGLCYLGLLPWKPQEALCNITKQISFTYTSSEMDNFIKTWYFSHHQTCNVYKKIQNSNFCSVTSVHDWKNSSRLLLYKNLFFTDSPLLILKSIYKIYNDWYMYYQFISFLFWQQYRRAKFPSIVVPVGTKHLISESLVILSCHIISLSCSFVVPGAVL